MGAGRTVPRRSPASTALPGRPIALRLAAVLAALALALVCSACVEADAGGSETAAEPDDRPTTTSDTTVDEVPSSGAPSTDGTPSTSAHDLPDGRDVVVTSITDGDTFRAGDERVRLIGIDTPEISGGVECYGHEASDALAALIPVGTEVRLVTDVEPVDRYDRTLAYVYRTSDGLHVNLRMAADGFASPLTVPPNVAHAEDFVAAAGEARDAGLGLWSACEDSLDLPSPTTQGPAGAGGGPGPDDASAAGCDPAYPDVCIPPSPPDLDCADIPYRRFRVLPPDPHRFDGGGDGIGCERD